ncbi:hypothetical protein GCM10022225_04210 [Plantactinospora mayteni]|uniref:Cell wall anchor protein n=1 Tax=Plantactinospora mayteni TaxID=566021 RepID=A0ABQ4EQI1_9ACTN|nr:cell wall anchor protein [Plantactinospora mayteni]GIG96910.1 hypothetical protein Pma05_34830 [Plantactinospora mayteni]
MIRPKLSLRRSAAVLGAAFLGLGAAVAIAAPASAHHPEIYGSFCKVQGSNNYEFQWTVGNSENIKAEVIRVEPGAVGEIQVGAEMNPKGGAPLTGTETRTAPSKGQLDKSLLVEAKWKRPDRVVKEFRKVEAKDKGKCATPPTTPPTTPEPTPPVTPTPEPTPPATPTPEPTPPATPTPEPTPSTTPEPVEPVGTYESTCDELIITLENTTDAEISVVLTPNEGEAKTLTVAPGKTGSVSFPAKEGLTVTPSGEGLEGEPIGYEQPEECGGGGGGDLPLTGAAAGGIAGGAVLLLAAGVVLYIVARRRRVTFTA